MSNTVVTNLDHDLVKKCCQGNAVADEKLYVRYYPRVLDYCTKCLKSHDDGADATQEVFIKALVRKKIADCRNAAQLWPWIRKVAHNECMAIYRKKKRNREMNLFDDERFSWLQQIIPVEQPDPEECFVQDELNNQLHDAICQLPKKYHAVIKTTCLEGCSYKETANILDLSIVKVGLYLHRAKKMLAKLFNDKRSLKKNNTYKAKADMKLKYRMAW